MAKNLLLSDLDTYFQDRIKTTVGNRLDQTTRVRIMNQIISMLQAAANWSPTKRKKTISYLAQELDYHIVNVLGISDFKDGYDIQDPQSSYERFMEIDTRLITQYEREGRVLNVYAVEEIDNADVLKLIYRNGSTRTQVANLDSLTEDGTWASDTTDSDATTLVADANRKWQGSGSLKFNVDVSQSSNNKAVIRNTTLTALDLTDYQNIAHWRARLDLQQLTAAQLATIASVEIRFGDDTSNYHAIVKTAPADGGSFQAGWNLIDWDWKDVTTTESPTIASVNYIDLIINYSASMTDANNLRWDDLVLILPRELDFVYFSENFVLKPDATFATEFTTSTVDGTERLLLPTAHRDDFIHLCAEYGFAQMKHEGSQERTLQILKDDKVFKRLYQDLGSPIVRNIPSVLIRGNSSGRADGRTQW